MKKKTENENQNVGRIYAKRHLDLNRLMKEHFCGQDSDWGKKKSKKKKGKK